MYKIFFNNNFIILSDGESCGFGCGNNCETVFFENVVQFQKIIAEVESKSINFCVVYHDKEKLFKKFRSYFKELMAAGGLVTNSSGDVLVIKRHDLWDLPKGKAKKGETPEITAIREVEEECGIKDLSIIKHIANTFHTYHQKGKHILKTTWWYKMKYAGNETPTPQTEESITEAIWHDATDLDAIRENTYLSLQEIFDDIS